MLKLSYIQATIFHLYGILIFVFPRIFVQDFNRQMDEKYIYIMLVTTRKSINTNRNTEGITVGKKIKTKQKKMMCHFLPT
jgi:hypothetical protein